MDVSSIQTLISAVGFPIVCCGAMFWFVNKTMKEFTKDIRDTVDDLTESISQNTTATTRLVSTVEVIAKIGSGEDG